MFNLLARSGNYTNLQVGNVGTFESGCGKNFLEVHQLGEIFDYLQQFSFINQIDFVNKKDYRCVDVFELIDDICVSTKSS